jgi:hypothetical protein
MPEWFIKCNTIVEMYNGQGFERDRVVCRRGCFFGEGHTGMKIIFKTGGWGGENVHV